MKKELVEKLTQKYKENQKLPEKERRKMIMTCKLKRNIHKTLHIAGYVFLDEVAEEQPHNILDLPGIGIVALEKIQDIIIQNYLVKYKQWIFLPREKI